MMPSRVRRLRLLLTLSAGVIIILLWSRNAAVVDVYRRYGAQQAVGGGSVLRPDLQHPELHEPSLEDRLKSDALNNAPPAPPPEEPPSIDDLLDSPAAMETQEPKEPTEESHTSSTSSGSASSSKASTASESAVTASESASTDSTSDLDDDAGGRNPNGYGYGRKEISVDPSSTTNGVHWSGKAERYPISTTIQLPTGTPKALPRIQREINKLSMYGADEEKLKAIKAAAEHSWKGYRSFAFQEDELRPVSHMAANPFNGWGATLVDSLDTLWIMGMKKEFEEAVQAVGKIDFTTSRRSDIPLFETVIRYLGGLIAAYDVSGKQHIILLDKAVQLAEVLYGAFDTPNRAPMPYYRWQPSTSSSHSAGVRVILAELGTLSLEFTRLAQLTGEPKYYDAIARLTDMFEAWQKHTRLPGMWPTYFDASGCGVELQQPSTATQNQKPVSDSSASSTAHEVAAGSEGLGRVGHPGALEDDGTGKHEAEDEFYNEESHGNTWKRKRQIEEDPSAFHTSGVVEQEFEKPYNRTILNHTAVDSLLSDSSSTGYTSEDSHKNELRDPQSSQPENVVHLVRDEDTCIPKGFTSYSESSQESFTLSGMSDSMYEYLPKEYILLGGLVDKYRTMYLSSAKIAIEKLLYKPMTKDERDILMSGELRISPDRQHASGEEGAYVESFTPEGAHLACFAGGMFALGGVIFNEPEHVDIGSKLTDGCVWMYNVTASGIMPEGAVLMQCEDTWGKCEWNEEAYWAVLDPYAEERTGLKVADPPSDPVPAHHPGSEGTSRSSRGGRSSRYEDGDDLHGENLNEHAHDDARDSGNALTKRQLEVDDDEDEEDEEDEDSDSPPPPTPASHPTPASPYRDPVRDANTPLSHREFVEKKIEDERLPPGFVHINSRKYILRPEAIESVFYMYRITGDPHWREVGWNMWTSIETHTRAAFGHSAIDDITKEIPMQLDSMESFWMAETLKYFYLLYDDPATWSLDEWVLNTEAHFFRRP